MASKDVRISDAEWELMESVWRENDQTAGQVIGSVSADNRSHRTLRTLLARLVKKGAVSVKVVGNRHLYSANVSREMCVRIAAKEFSQRFFGGSLHSLMLHFVEHESLTPAEVDELRRRLQLVKQEGKDSDKKSRRARK